MTGNVPRPALRDERGASRRLSVGLKEEQMRQMEQDWVTIFRETDSISPCRRVVRLNIREFHFAREERYGKDTVENRKLVCQPLEF
jgi:hypothetical protein